MMRYDIGNSVYKMHLVGLMLYMMRYGMKCSSASGRCSVSLPGLNIFRVCSLPSFAITVAAR